MAIYEKNMWNWLFSYKIECFSTLKASRCICWQALSGLTFSDILTDSIPVSDRLSSCFHRTPRRRWWQYHKPKQTNWTSVSKCKQTICLPFLDWLGSGRMWISQPQASTKLKASILKSLPLANKTMPPYLPNCKRDGFSAGICSAIPVCTRSGPDGS